MRGWLRNIKDAVFTVLQGMWITLRYWMITYRPERKTFTEHFEYPEIACAGRRRYRGFHRYDLTTCIACDQCAKACPVDCIYIGKERVTGARASRSPGSRSTTQSACSARCASSLARWIAFSWAPRTI